jgi:DMSO/TMAO reductase YedYZ molybdopterin-dependent catalytic subunit
VIGDAKTPEEAERERRLREMTDDGEIISKAEYTKRSRRAFLAFGALGLAGYAGFNRLQNQDEDEGIPKLLRAGLEWNENVWERVQRDGATARTFAIADREEIRVNGRHGLENDDRELIEVDDAESADWEIALTGRNGAQLAPIPLTSLKSDFEVHDMVWEHKCVEGWANIVHWTGVRFSDVLERYAPDEASAEWMVLRTPNSPDVRRDYSTAIENYTMMHQQTLLAWQLNGEPLSDGHGAPIRIVTPLKYGIKQLKRLASIEFTDDRPTDYWTERGYDLHAGF